MKKLSEARLPHKHAHGVLVTQGPTYARPQAKQVKKRIHRLAKRKTRELARKDMEP